MAENIPDWAKESSGVPDWAKEKAAATIGQEILASQPGRFLTGATGFIDAGAQLLPRALETVTSIGGFNPNPVSKFFGEQAASVDQIVAQKKAEMDAAKAATNFQGADIAGFLGNVAQPPNILAMKALGATTKTIPALIEAGTGMGMLGGLISPVTSNNQDFNTQKVLQTVGGGALGGILAPIPALAGRGYELAKAMIQPFTESGRKSIVGSTLRGQVRPSDLGDTLNRMTNATELVPGSQPTVAEVAESGGLAAMQRQAQAANPDIFTPRKMSQVQARREAAYEVAGDAGKKELFEAAREDAANLLYKDAYKQTLNINRDPLTGKMLPKADRDVAAAEMADLLDTPAIQQAMKDAVVLAKNERVNVKDPKGSILGLDYTKRALDKQITTAESDNEKRILMGVKERLMTFLQKQSPKYAEAVATYAEGSKPINQMAVGEYLKNKLIPAIGEEGGLLNETGAAYAKALRDSAQTAKAATGFKGATLESVFADNRAQLQTLQNIAKDIARGENAKSLGLGIGSNTYQNLAMANASAKSGLPLMALEAPGINALSRWIYKNPSETMQRQLAEALTDPKVAAKLIADAAPKDRSRLMAAALRNQLTPAMFGGASSAALLP
tara:strand:- start:59 stop:1906 length:1848 start_codon:yes stop_codon:yes gene_type:complete